MRQNQVHYIALMDVFAPCIVSSSVWNNDALMAKYCGDNQDNFQEYVLTISERRSVYVVGVGQLRCALGSRITNGKADGESLLRFANCCSSQPAYE